MFFKTYAKKLTENFEHQLQEPLHQFPFDAQFNYWSLIWMLHSRQNNKKIKHFYKRCLRLIQKDNLSSHEKLLEKDVLVFHLFIYLFIYLFNLLFTVDFSIVINN